MNGERVPVASILSRVSGLDPDMLNGLVLIKYICTASDEARRWSREISCNDGETLWNMIVQEACKIDGHVSSAIEFAIDQIKRDLPFAADLAERLRTAAVDENTLREIVHLLSNTSTDNDALSSIFEYNLARKARIGSSNSGDFYRQNRLFADGRSAGDQTWRESIRPLLRERCNAVPHGPFSSRHKSTAVWTNARSGGLFHLPNEPYVAWTFCGFGETSCQYASGGCACRSAI